MRLPISAPDNAIMYIILRHQKKRSVTSHTPFGLTRDWQKSQPIYSSSPAGILRGNEASGSTLDPDSDTDIGTGPAARQRHLSRTSTITGTQSFHAATSEPDGVPPYNYGGFMPENSGSERFELEGEKNASESMKYKVRLTTTRRQCLTT